MSIIRINRHRNKLHAKYNRVIDVRNMIEYLTRPHAFANVLANGSNNLIYPDVILNTEFTIEQFLAAQADRNIDRRLYHIVIAPDPVLELGDIDGRYAHCPQGLLNRNINTLCRLGDFILKLYPDYQSFYVIHNSSDPTKMHLHILFNNCPINPYKPTLTDVFKTPTIYLTVEKFFPT